MSKIKAVLFDFDGTLIDTNQLVLDSWHNVYKAYGITPPADEVLTATFGQPLEDALAEFFPEYPVEESARHYRSFQQDHFSGTARLYEGIPQLLQELKARGYLLAIVTSRLWASLKSNKYEFHQQDLFDAIVSQEDTDVHKPQPEPCLIALRKLGISPEEAIMVGDSRLDILCGKNAGCKTALVGWSVAFPPETATGEAKPDHIIYHAQELLELLQDDENGTHE
ncbi:MAG: HAD-IA family hydrolase [Firmicutes bacterium]|nr:HAD-IA family hydrolase [Bacillota bacterium]